MKTHYVERFDTIIAEGLCTLKEAREVQKDHPDSEVYSENDKGAVTHHPVTIAVQRVWEVAGGR